MSTIVRTNSSSHIVAENYEDVKASLASGDDFVSLTELLYFGTPAESHNDLWLRASQVVSVNPRVDIDVSNLTLPEPTILD